DVARLAGIADGTGDVGVQVDVTKKLVAPIDWRDRRIALDRPETIGAFEQLARLRLAQELLEPPCRGRVNRSADGQENRDDESANRRKRQAVERTGKKTGCALQKHWFSSSPAQ